MKENKNVGLNFILSGWGWGGRLTQNLEKSKKKYKTHCQFSKFTISFITVLKRGGGAIVQN